MSILNQSKPFTLVLFGATGDLAKRKLFPAIYNLYLSNQLPEHFTVIGASRTPRTHEQFREAVHNSIQEFSRKKIQDEKKFSQFLKSFFYNTTDINDVATYQGILSICKDRESRAIPANRLFYLSVGPELFGRVATNLNKTGLTKTTGWKRLIIEKPFGYDYDSAQELNAEIKKTFTEEETYRIDHYLGKEMVQNIEVIRFANSFLEPLWNHQYIENIQISASETVGVEERSGYYDEAGALRDMVQNHMLQLLMMVAMEPPSRFDEIAIHEEKTKVLRAIRRVPKEQMAEYVVRGQYGEGKIKGKSLPAYRQEKNIPKSSTTETYVGLKFMIDNHRWAGVPFYIRTGKRMPVKATEIVIQFKELSQSLYSRDTKGLGPNLLVIRINPNEGVHLFMNTKQPGTFQQMKPVTLHYQDEAKEIPEAYESLIQDAIVGDRTFFTHQDEVSHAWEITDPIYEAFQENIVPLSNYPSGSWGPTAADQLLAVEQDHWWAVGDLEMQLKEIYNQEKEKEGIAK